MGWENRGSGDLPPFGRQGDFERGGEPDALGDQETHILPQPPQGQPSGGQPSGGQPSQPAELAQSWQGEASVPQDDWITQDLPPELARKPLPKKLPRELGAARRSRRPLIIAISAVLVVAVVAGGIAFAVRGMQTGTPGKPGGPNCGSNTPCKVAQDYLAAYTGGNYEQMYAQTSSASRKRFGDPAILQGNYKDAHDYIVNRTSALVNEARIYQMGATQETAKQTSATTATVLAHIEMKSSRLGTITQDITLPLTQEQGTWRVDWSPGLVFSQLDDTAADPHYTRKLHLFMADGSRGTIFDRDGNVLAQDTTVYQIGVVPGNIKNEAAMLSVLSTKLGISQQNIKSAYAGASSGDFVVIRTVPPQLYTTIQDAINAQIGNGVKVQPTMGRVYPYGTDTAAVTGYVSIVTPDDLKNDSSHYYEQGDLVGHAGVEQWAEQSLRPIRGGKLDIVNINADGTFGQVAYTVTSRAAANGADVHTTISISNQQAAMGAMRATPTGQGIGAFEVVPSTGEVLVMASWPACDPNDFSLGFGTGINACVGSAQKPLLNYAIQSAVPTGSVFKIVTMAAALENGYTSTQQIACPGSYQVPGESDVRHDWVPGGRGNMTLEVALAASCDTVFWQVGVALDGKDPNILPSMAKSFGFGAATGVVGVASGVENPGLVPDPAWVQKQGKQWSASNAADLAIGQGDFEATPAQVAMMSAAIANNGVRMQPRLVTSVTDLSGRTVASYPATQLGTLPVSAANLQNIEVGMVMATSTPQGTSSSLFRSFSISVAGKTGSAESGQPTPHAWFACFAPAAPLSAPQTPVQAQVASGVLNAYAGHGADWAAPITLAMLHAYFKV